MKRIVVTAWVLFRRWDANRACLVETFSGQSGIIGTPQAIVDGIAAKVARGYPTIPLQNLLGRFQP